MNYFSNPFNLCCFEESNTTVSIYCPAFIIIFPDAYASCKMKYYFAAGTEFSEISITVNFTVNKFESKVLNSFCTIVDQGFNFMTPVNQHSAQVGANVPRSAGNSNFHGNWKFCQM